MDAFLVASNKQWLIDFTEMQKKKKKLTRSEGTYTSSTEQIAPPRNSKRRFIYIG